MQYREVQKIAKDTLQFMRSQIHAGMTLPEIRKMCEQKMLELGADSFWYWDIGSFVFAGSKYGYKWENIYYFENGKLAEL